MREVVQHWHVGDQVEERGGGAPFGAHVVIGYKPDGRCMTMLIDPPPWMTKEQRAQVYLTDPAELVPCELGLVACSP